MPEVSIIVPVYRAEQYLHSCIDSILSQTFSDFEVILVDDGSPDGSYAICREYARKDSRITVLRQENRGQAAARNHALTVAKGRWLCFVDSDDAIHPQMLELLWKAARDSGTSITQCAMLEAVELPEDFLRDRRPVFEKHTMDDETLAKLHDAEKYPGWVACGKLISRELVEGYPFREGRVYEDNEAVCRWICNAGKIASTDEQLYFYRGNPDSTTKREFSLKRLDYLWALESIVHHYSELDYPQMRQRFLDRYVEAVASCCNGVRYGLNRPDVVKTIEKQVRSCLRREKASVTKAQFEALLEVMHPQWMRLYWPAAGGISTLRRQGIAGLVKKIRKQLGKDDV